MVTGEERRFMAEHGPWGRGGLGALSPAELRHLSHLPADGGAWRSLTFLSLISLQVKGGGSPGPHTALGKNKQASICKVPRTIDCLNRVVVG